MIKAYVSFQSPPTTTDSFGSRPLNLWETEYLRIVDITPTGFAEKTENKVAQSTAVFKVISRPLPTFSNTWRIAWGNPAKYLYITGVLETPSELHLTCEERK